MEQEDRLMSVGKVSKRVGMSVKSLQRYDRLGRLHPDYISPTGRRLYSTSQVDKFVESLRNMTPRKQTNDPIPNMEDLLL